jgi:hypothetical protein
MAKPVATTGDDAVARVQAQRQRAHALKSWRGYWTEGKRVILTPIAGLTRPDLFGEAFRFQMPPTSDLVISFAVTYNDTDTIGGQQQSRAGAVQLRSTSLDTLALDYDVTWASHHSGFPGGDPAVAYTALNDGQGQTFTPGGRVVAPPSPIVVRNQLEDIAEARTPFMLEVSQPGVYAEPDIHWAATLRQVQTTERPGEPDARYFSLAFTEFRRPDLLTRRALGKARAPSYHAKLPVTLAIGASSVLAADGHRFPDDVSLADLATTYYGAPSKWRAIVAANKALKSWPQSRPLRELRNSRHGAPIKLTIPKVRHAAGQDFSTTA